MYRTNEHKKKIKFKGGQLGWCNVNTTAFFSHSPFYCQLPIKFTFQFLFRSNPTSILMPLLFAIVLFIFAQSFLVPHLHPLPYMWRGRPLQEASEKRKIPLNSSCHLPQLAGGGCGRWKLHRDTAASFHLHDPS